MVMNFFGHNKTKKQNIIRKLSNKIGAEKKARKIIIKRKKKQSKINGKSHL